MGSETIQMKISLDYIKPEIWRRFIVDSSISLADLHNIIQVVMGWTDSHLHGFFIKDTEYMPEDNESESDAEGTKTAILKSLKLKEREEFRYVYDFGDDWQHTVIVEKILKSDEKMIQPYCLDGSRNCPPEDCGSIPGYEDIIKAMKNQKSKQAKELIEWLGAPYDPDYFNIKEINDLLKPVKKTRKKKAGG